MSSVVSPAWPLLSCRQPLVCQEGGAKGGARQGQKRRPKKDKAKEVEKQLLEGLLPILCPGAKQCSTSADCSPFKAELRQGGGDLLG